MRKLKNSHFKIATLLILSSTAPLSALAQQPPPARGAMSYASPEATLDAYRAARDRQDWRTAYLCFTPGFQQAALLEAYFACRASNDPQLPGIMKQYGADEPSVDAEYGNRYRTKYGNDIANSVQPYPPLDVDLLQQALAARIVDDIGFYAAVHRVLGDRDSLTPMGKLEGLTVDGDRAVGAVSMECTVRSYVPGRIETLTSKMYTQTFQFRNLHGGWLIDDARAQMVSGGPRLKMPRQEPLVMPADAVMPKSPSDAPPVLGAFAWFGSAAWPMYRREVTPQPVSGLAPKYTGASASPYLNKNPTPNHLYPEPSDDFVAIYRGGNLRRSAAIQAPLSGTGTAAPAGNVTARVYVAGKSWLHGSKVIPMRGGRVPPPSGQIAVPIYRGGLLQSYRADAVPPDDPEPAMAPTPAPMENIEGTGLN